MSVFRVDKSRDFTVISNTVFKDKTLSARAKGLLAEMLSLPEDWDYTLKGLATLFSDGIDSIRSGIRELEAHGYMVRKRVRDEKGRLAGVEYVIYETPQPVENSAPTESEPTIDVPATESPSQEVATTYKILNKSNTKSSITLESNLSIPDPEPTPMDRIGYDEARELIRDNIEYDLICERYTKARIDEIVEIAAEALCSNRKYFELGKDSYPYALVKERLLKLDELCIEYVFMSLENTTSDIRNIKQYLLKTLVNAPATLEHYYGAKVNHDMFGGDEPCKKKSTTAPWL